MSLVRFPVAPQKTSIEEILLRFFRYKVLLWYYIIYSSYFVSLYYLLSTNRHLLNGIYISIMRKRRRSDHVQGTADGHKQSRLLQDKKWTALRKGCSFFACCHQLFLCRFTNYFLHHYLISDSLAEVWNHGSDGIFLICRLMIVVDDRSGEFGLILGWTVNKNAVFEWKTVSFGPLWAYNHPNDDVQTV